MKRTVVLLGFTAAILFCPVAALFAQETAAAAPAAGNTAVWRYFAAALAVGISCIAGGLAVGQIGSAAMGAMSENPELSGKALPYAGLAEGICLWGFLVGLLILIL
ncbi:MAG: ATP synthase subunit C [Treponema sp.]|jgi:V/A-type H+-transporting ATPase subunit K|nr:ATP synthase subunit C [Treponema sp.]